MPNYILFAGFSKRSYVRKTKQQFALRGYKFGCVFERSAITPAKKHYLEEFDIAIDLTSERGKEEIAALQGQIAAVTCTQERDMHTYTKLLGICGMITPKQHALYEAAIDKQRFKETLAAVAPELVPHVYDLSTGSSTHIPETAFPLVLKPSGLAGSTLVKIVSERAEIDVYINSHQAAAERIAKEHYHKDIMIIAEEYIAGPQYSINVYVNTVGTPILCPIIRVVTPQELGKHDTYSALQYVTSELTGEQLQNLRKAIDTVVETFNISGTSMHFDAVLSEHGWKFFEIGLRIGGNRQTLFEKTHTMNHIGNDIENRLGNEVYLPARTASACIVQTASQKRGHLCGIKYERNITTAKPVLVQEDRIAKVGSRVKPLSDGGGTLTRHFVVGSNEQKVVEAATALYHSIEHDIETT